jgi:hypothetical protein
VFFSLYSFSRGLPLLGCALSNNVAALATAMMSNLLYLGGHFSGKRACD